MPPESHCHRCKGKTVYHRLYSGENLCTSCFKTSIVEKTRKTISKYNMFKHGDKIAVAVSGGKDSLSLLHILKELSDTHSSKLHAIMVDEGVDGYRDEAVDLTKAFSEKIKVPLLVTSYKELYDMPLDEALDWKVQRRVSSCSICGTFRKRAIDLAAKKINADVVATGHNLDDFLQTYFINLFNADLRRIRWLDPTHQTSNDFGLRRVKPFMEVYEQELAFYAYISNLPLQSAKCPYMDEGIRTEVREFLNGLETKHHGIKYGMLKSVVDISQNMDTSYEKPLIRCQGCGNPSSSVICSVCRTIKLIEINK